LKLTTLVGSCNIPEQNTPTGDPACEETPAGGESYTSRNCKNATLDGDALDELAGKGLINGNAMLIVQHCKEASVR
jgi:hypothetical protein